MIECRCMGVSATAVARSKQEARALAAEKVLCALMPKKAEAAPKRVTKRIAKPSRKRGDGADRTNPRPSPSKMRKGGKPTRK